MRAFPPLTCENGRTTAKRPGRCANTELPGLTPLGGAVDSVPTDKRSGRAQRRARTVQEAIAARRAEIMPLEQFPADHRALIEAAIADPNPPERYRYFGDPDGARPIAYIESRAWLEWHWARGMWPGLQVSRPSIPRWMREAVLERDGTVCQLCGGDVEPDDIHLDHIHPFSKGGKTTVSNLQVTHSRCNMRKAAKV